MTKRKRSSKEEYHVQEECDKWLTTIGKQKVVNTTTRKTSSSKAAVNRIKLILTQTTNPSKATKQTRIDSFFKAKAGTHNEEEINTVYQEKYSDEDYNQEEYVDSSQSIQRLISHEEPLLREYSSHHQKENKCKTPNPEDFSVTTYDAQPASMIFGRPRHMLVESEHHDRALLPRNSNVSTNVTHYQTTDKENCLSNPWNSGDRILKLLNNTAHNGNTKDEGDSTEDLTDNDYHSSEGEQTTHLPKLDPWRHSTERDDLQLPGVETNDNSVDTNTDFSEFTFHTEKWGNKGKYNKYQKLPQNNGHDTSLEIRLPADRKLTHSTKCVTEFGNTSTNTDYGGDEDYSEFTFHSEKWGKNKKYQKYRNCQVINIVENTDVDSKPQQIESEAASEPYSEFTFHSEKWGQNEKYKKYEDVDTDDVDNFTFHSQKHLEADSDCDGL